MESNESSSNFMLNEITTDESAIVSGGASNGNFDISSYTYIVGGGAVFGVPSDTARDYAFQQALYVSSTTPTPLGGGGGTYTPT